jgi:alpha-N-acetylglucosamine transferase
MALLKVTPWSFTQYDRVQFFDGDVMPYKNMDCFFKLNHNSFTVGAVSPLNSGRTSLSDG